MISLTSPIRTRAHNWPAGLKLAGLCASTIALFLIISLPAHAIILAGVMLAYLLPGRLFFLSGLSRLRMLWPFVVVICVWHMLVGAPGEGIAIGLVIRMTPVLLGKGRTLIES